LSARAAHTPFDGLRLGPELLQAIASCGYERPTAIQARAIPFVLDGHDLIGVAQTGTGKTAAFAWPILQSVLGRAPDAARSLDALVVAPTRELARQIHAMFVEYAKGLGVRIGLVHGGLADKSNEVELEQGVDVLVATPGRLLDLESRGVVQLSAVQILVLDEFDRMLDMGFLPDVQALLERMPTELQKLFFSATLPQRIRQIAETLLDRPMEVSVDIAATPAQTVEQKVYFVRRSNKGKLLVHLIENKGYERVLCFTRRKSEAEKIAMLLREAGISAEFTHGDLKQSRRQYVLGRFAAGELQVLVASDLASRGIDVEGVTHVINYDLPHEAGTYVHRIGRTGRAGRAGVAISLCDERDFEQLRHVELLLGRPIPVVTQHAFSHGAVLPPPPIGKGIGSDSKKRRGRGKRRRQRHQRRH
jgi:ATP-dependent RNA helicase RhlE